MTQDLDNTGPGAGATAPAANESRCWRCGELPDPERGWPPCPRCGAGATPGQPGRGPGFFGGLAGVLRGLRFLNKNPRLWMWVLIPLVINAAIFGVIVWWSLGEADRFIPDMQTEWWPWIDWLRASLSWVLPKLMAVVVFLAAMIVTLLLSSIVNAPFYDLLSEKTEVTALGHPELERPWSKFLGDIAYSVLAAVHLVVRQVVIMAILFALSFTAIGAPLFMLAGFFFSGFALVDMTLARKRYPARERAAWGRRHVPHLIGLGIPVNLFPPLAPMGVVAATLAYLEQPKKGPAQGRS